MRRAIVYVLLLVLGVYSCTGVKYISSDKKFYNGSKIEISDKINSVNSKALLSELTTAISPKPNEKIFGMRPAVCIGGMTEDSKKSFGKFINKSFGQAPIIYDSSLLIRTKKILANRLFNEGYFNHRIYHSINESKREISIKYKIQLAKPYLIDDIYVPEDSLEIFKEIKSIESKSLLKKGEPYSLNNLKEERIRLNRHLKNNGYYYFNPDLILYQVDTTQKENKVQLRMLINHDASSRVFERVKIDSILLVPNYNLNNDSLEIGYVLDTMNNLWFKDNQKTFKHKIFHPLISISHNKEYKLEDHDLTIKRISELDAFKFINVAFRRFDENLHAINALIELTPKSRHAIGFNIEATSKSNNFVGSELSLNYENRNIFRGAEVLKFDVSGGFETQIGNTNQSINSYQIGMGVGLKIPRFISPLDIKVPYTSSIPVTNIEIGTNILQRAGFYGINRTDMRFGYKWIGNKNKFHQLNPIDVNYVFLYQTTPEFDLTLASSPTLSQSFENQFLIGGTYSFTYTEPVSKANEDYFYFKGNLNLSGNIIGATQDLTNNKDQSEKNLLFGQPYSQYVRGDFDFRYFLNFNERHSIASRVILGIGIPYGNSQQLPYIKQFFIGGSNSLRAFPARGIGPGSYKPEETNALFLDQSGDLKLEANLEYRGQIYGALKGAFFIDAGNVWLLSGDDTRVGGVFEFQNLYKEIGMGTGVGLRLDFTYFVIRSDWAIPIKKPYVEESNGWVLSKIDFWAKSWRRDNLVWNIAIGYPF